MVKHSSISRRARFLSLTLLSGLLCLLLASPGVTAERAYVHFGPLERSVLVADLAAFVRTGELPENLQHWRRILSSEQLEQLRMGLSASVDIDVVTVSQFLYTAQGEAILQWLGDFIQTEGRQNGALGLRGATILATADSDGGLTVLNLLKHFPTQGARVNLGWLLGVGRQVTREVNQTNAVTEQLFAQVSPGPVTGAIGELAAPGSENPDFLPLEQTTLPTHLYLPSGENLPLVVLSHGLGGNRSTLSYLATHLASHGFAVAVVEHPGSSEAQISELLAGKVGEAVEPEEMVRRPLDIRQLLDELEMMTTVEPALQNRIDFQQVGVVGHSMGGYTSLALAGATVDLQGLEESCPSQISQLNLSLLLQCLVLSLPQPPPVLEDRRVKAAIAINPLSSAIFGPEGMANIEIPTLVVSGSADTVTPALAEQIRPFTWLDTPQRYLMLMDGGTHFSAIYDVEGGDGLVDLPELALGPAPQLAQDYIKGLGLAFLKTHLAGDTTYQQYLEPAQATGMSQPELPMVLLDDVAAID